MQKKLIVACMLLLVASAFAATDVAPAGLSRLATFVENTYVRDLEPEVDDGRHAPNRQPRSVISGHYVLVKPTPLPEPALLAVSDEMCAALHLSPADCRSEQFARLFSGADLSADLPGFSVSWATPYALSIYGQEIVPNGAGRDGNGYGDGRAVSIAEVAVDDDTTNNNVSRYELQLKGGGRTPFCRGADGRAVLRSSAREFIASEAMHALGVPTTRALSLVASSTERVERPWYRNASTAIALGAHRAERHGGDTMVAERCAITTRVARSFVRVGQFELYGRRARKGDPTGLRQLRLLARHALRREYPSAVAAAATSTSTSTSAQASDGGSSASAASSSISQAEVLAMAREASHRFALLAAEWVRVGYVQSNFNADNCLVGGATVDYGPFGFLEKYDPAWAMWIGGGQHFSFMNQPKAAGENLKMFLRALEPLVDSHGVSELRAVYAHFAKTSEAALARMWARKLGMPDTPDGHAAAASLWSALEPLLRAHPTDWTLFWRQLSEVPSAARHADDDVLVDLLAPALYEPLATGRRHERAAWLRSWLAVLRERHEIGEGRGDGFGHGDGRGDGSGDDDGDADDTLENIGDAMRRANPKFVPREWLLAEAYTAAAKGDMNPLHALHDALKRPYDEQPAVAAHYYRRAPIGADQQGGLGFMS